MADNFRFDISGAPLHRALSISFIDHNKVVGWSIDKDGLRLILFWAESPGMTKLPAPLRLESAVHFVESWLESIDYGRRPDTDGSVSKGSRVYNGAWGHVDNKWQAFVAIEPYWNLHGK